MSDLFLVDNFICKDDVRTGLLAEQRKMDDLFAEKRDS